MTLILSLTLAPPRIAANGRSGASSSFESIAISRSMSSPAYAGSSFGDADRRGVRSMRRPEGVVDVDVGVRGERRGEGRVVGLLLGVEAQVLEQQDLAGPHPLERVLGPEPEGVAGHRHVAPEQLGQALADRAQPEAVGDLAVRAGRGGWRG